MEESKRYILSTRPLDESLVQKAADKNIVIESLSFIQTEPITGEEIRKRISNASGQLLTVVFTSMNAAEAVANLLPRNTPQWKIYCLGTATKNVVELQFGNDLIAATAFNASSLADKIISDGVAGVVFFCGDLRRDELPAKLAANNIEVEEMVVYKKTLIKRRVEKRYDGILFFSPSAVESFFSSNNVLADTTLFAIGNTTAESIHKFSNNRIIESDIPGKDNLVEIAISYLDNLNKTNDHIKE